jgi:hypothetical protein
MCFCNHPRSSEEGVDAAVAVGPPHVIFSQDKTTHNPLRKQQVRLVAKPDHPSRIKKPPWIPKRTSPMHPCMPAACHARVSLARPRPRRLPALVPPWRCQRSEPQQYPWPVIGRQGRGCLKATPRMNQWRWCALQSTGWVAQDPNGPSSLATPRRVRCPLLKTLSPRRGGRSGPRQRTAAHPGAPINKAWSPGARRSSSCCVDRQRLGPVGRFFSWPRAAAVRACGGLAGGRPIGPIVLVAPGGWEGKYAF